MGVLNWSNALSHAGGAAAQLGLEGVRSTLDQQKIELASRLAEQRQIGAETRAPGVAAATETAVGTAREGLLAKNAAAQLQRDVDRKRALGAEELKIEISKFEKLAPLQRQEAIDTELAKVNALATPEMLKKTKAIAEAKHIVDPSYQLMPQADGTVVAVNARNPKDTKVLMDADGKPLIRKDPEEMKAAVAVINMANTNLRIAEAAYKVDAASLEPGVKEKAAVAWQAAQREAKMLSAPAYAVLYAKAKIPGVAETPAAETPTPGDADIAKLKTNPKTFSTIFDAKFGAGAAAKALGTTAKAADEPTIHIPPGGVDPNVALNERRRAEIRAREEAELEEKRQRRVAARASEAGLINNFNATLSR